jgi:formylmethanofuran dehydrogenase subunit A
LHGTEAGSAAHVVHDAGVVSVREATDFTGDEPAEISG